MSQASRKAKKRVKRQARDEGIEATLEGLYEHGKRLSVLKRDMSAADREQFQRRQAQVGLASNALGIAAGTAALATAAKNPALRPSKANEKTAGPVSRRVMGKIKSAKGKKALIVGGAAGALGLQAANLGGDVVANRVLARESGVGKADMKDKLMLAGIGAGATGAASAVAGSAIQRNVNAARQNAKYVRVDATRGMDTYQIAQARAMYGDKWREVVNREANAGAPVPPRQRRVRGMSFSEARRLMGTRAATELKAKGMAANARGVLRRNGKGALIGGALGAGFGASMALKEPMKKSIEQSAISKSDPMVVSGHGVNIEKRNFNAEADRQRRLGLYTGAGLGAGLVLGDAARRRAPLKTVELKDGSRRKVIDLPKGRRGKLTLAALAGGAALSAGGGVAAYRRGISERNNAYL